MKRSVVLISIGFLSATLLPAIGASQQSAAAAKEVAAPATAAAAPAFSAPSTAVPATVPPAAAPSAAAPAPKSITVPPETLRSVAELAGGGVKPADVRATPVAGVFEVRRAGDIIYLTQDGRWVFTGDMYNVATRTNLTEARRSELRKQLIDAVPESKMVVFSPPQPKYTVTVFTDVDCPYCRELHRQIAQYNKLGVSVRYIFFPRSGPNTESWFKAEQIWCSTDRKAAFTDAKLGKPLQAKVCADTPVAQEYELGRQIGLEGTPGIVASNGAMLGGYLPPDELVEQLKQIAK